MKWKTGETSHCESFQLKLFSTFTDEQYSCSSLEFNGFQYFHVSVLMLFHCSFNIGNEIGDGRGKPLQLISVKIF